MASLFHRLKDGEDEHQVVLKPGKLSYISLVNITGNWSCCLCEGHEKNVIQLRRYRQILIFQLISSQSLSVYNRILCYTILKIKCTQTYLYAGQLPTAVYFLAVVTCLVPITVGGSYKWCTLHCYSARSIREKSISDWFRV